VFLHRISIFEEELKVKLGSVVPLVRARLWRQGNFTCPQHNTRLQNTSPLQLRERGIGYYVIVRITDCLSQWSDRESLLCISQGKLVAPLLQCVDGWTGTPGPFLQHYLG
jgi:phenylalanine ammonia-lyase